MPDWPPFSGQRPRDGRWGQLCTGGHRPYNPNALIALLHNSGMDKDGACRAAQQAGGGNTVSVLLDGEIDGPYLCVCAAQAGVILRLD